MKQLRGWAAGRRPSKASIPLLPPAVKDQGNTGMEGK